MMSANLMKEVGELLDGLEAATAEVLGNLWPIEEYSRDVVRAHMVHLLGAEGSMPAGKALNTMNSLLNVFGMVSYVSKNLAPEQKAAIEEINRVHSKRAAIAAHIRAKQAPEA